METTDTLSSCTDSDEQEMQRLQKQAKILKANSLNEFNALKTTTQRLERNNFPNCPLFQRAFSSLFGNDVRTFKFELIHNMNNLERQLNKEILHEKDSKSDLSVIKVQFHKFLHSEEVKPSNYDGQHVRENFKQYTRMEFQSFKDLIIQHMDSIDKCIVERAHHDQEIQNRLKRLNGKKLQIQECKVQEVKALDASSGYTDSSGIISDKGNVHCSKINYSKTGNAQSSKKQSRTFGNESSRSGNECNERSNSWDDTDIRPSYDTKPMAEVPEYNVFIVETQHTEQPKYLNDTSLMEKVDSNTTLDSSDMCNNEFEDDHNADDHKDERVVLANLTVNLKLNIDENKQI
ncbi:hypothetical protein Tco_1442393 [Tanacetum coccineum]